MNENYLDSLLTRMIEQGDRKKRLAEGILNITAEQSKLLTPEKVEELLTAIDRKQELIDEINLIDVEVLPLEKEISSLSAVMVCDELNKRVFEKRKEIDSQIQKIVLLFKETSKLEKENLSKMSTEHKKLKKNIEMLHTKRGTVKAYNMHAVQSDGYFVDKKK
jgi:uncharacterized coiled-coil protein SlyX